MSSIVSRHFNDAQNNYSVVMKTFLHCRIALMYDDDFFNRQVEFEFLRYMYVVNCIEN